MAEPRNTLGCRRPLRHMKWRHVIWISPLVCRAFGGLWPRFAIFFTILTISFVGSRGSVGPYESILAGSVNGADSRRSVDKILQDYAFRAFRHPRTGIIYGAAVPKNLSGIKVDALRLRSGSLRRREVLYNEFDLPTGIAVSPYVERLVLVYQNFANWSSLYYNSPGYQLVAPVLGLLAYDASNLNATNLQELNIVATKDPILIRFSNLSSTGGLTPMCIFFYLNGTASLSNVSSPNVCSTNSEGHFSLVIPSLAPAPVPALAPTPVTIVSPLPQPPSVPSLPTPSSPRAPPGKASQTWKIAVGSSVGGVVAFVLAVFLCFGLLKYRQKSNIEHMELQAEEAETLQTARVGGTRAPTAGGTRTQPMLENEYIA